MPKTTIQNGPIFFDEPTSHRIQVNNRPRVVYERRDFNGEFVRFVAYRTPQEIANGQKAYLPARVGITNSYEVMAWEIGL